MDDSICCNAAIPIGKPATGVVAGLVLLWLTSLLLLVVGGVALLCKLPAAAAVP
jgi:hypothetical protein